MGEEGQTGQNFYAVAEYDPPGNVDGGYEDNVQIAREYVKGVNERIRGKTNNLPTWLKTPVCSIVLNIEKTFRKKITASIVFTQPVKEQFQSYYLIKLPPHKWY